MHFSFNVFNLYINFSSFTHYHRRFSRRQLRYVYYTCAILLYVLWDMRNRYVFVSCSTRVESSMRCALMSTTYLHIKDREIDIEITEKTIDKKEFFCFYWGRQHDFFSLLRINKRVTLFLVRQSIISQIGIQETTFNMWLQKYLTSFRIFLWRHIAKTLSWIVLRLIN